MATAPFFTLPLAKWQLPKSSQSLLDGSRKRKRDENYDVEKEDPDSLPGGMALSSTGFQSSQYSEYSAILSPDDRRQYKTAGHPLDDDVPDHPFPHAAAKIANSGKNTSHTLEQVASSFPSPIPSSHPEALQENLRFQHLRVLTAMLHRCLVGGDFLRAGRAWGMILRHEFGGHAVDIRSDGRWGIGAEILLRQHAQSLSNRDSQVAKNHDFVAKKWFTRKGFEDAKAYYERLIVQYPYHSRAPQGINALDFYPAMFGLWIYVVQEEAKMEAKDSSGQVIQPDEGELDTVNENQSINSELLDTSQRASQKEDRVLGQAREIARRMNALLSSPLYGESVELLRLRGMVALWIADLSVRGLQVNRHEGGR